jgi:hypothetical protein
MILGCLAVFGCSSRNAAPAPALESTVPRSEGADQPQPSAAEVRPDDLRGTWVEYWAVDGGVDTERYSFSELGRFEWTSSYAAKSGATAPQTAVRKTGAFRIERNGATPVLVLEVEHETFAACAAPCAGSNEPREVDHTKPIIERFELGECPSNPEAKQIDQSYTCRAFGGKAFWRKSAARSGESATTAG